MCFGCGGVGGWFMEVRGGGLKSGLFVLMADPVICIYLHI